MNRNLLFVGIAVLIGCAQTAIAQVAAGALTWHRDLGAAMADARESRKGVLAFFADQKSDASNKSWASLYDSSIVPLIRTSYVPLLVDWESQRALAAQLGVSEPGVAVIYDAKGAALRMLKAEEILDKKGLEASLKLAAGGNGAVATPATAAPVAQASLDRTPASVPTPQATPAASSSEDSFSGGIPADQVKREHLGQELVITGVIAVFETSGGPRIPFIATLAQRATDPVEVVYWEQTAAEIHAGRPLPKRGDRVTVKGTLTDYRGRLQIKVNSPRQIKLH